jgi:hypothetical protein
LNCWEDWQVAAEKFLQSISLRDGKVPYFDQETKVLLLGFVLGQRGFHSIQFSLRLSANEQLRITARPEWQEVAAD